MDSAIRQVLPVPSPETLNPLSKAVRVGNRHNVRLHPAALYEAVMDMGILLVVHVAVAVEAEPMTWRPPSAGEERRMSFR